MFRTATKKPGRRAWVSVENLTLDLVPHASGIYVVFGDDMPVYVGQSQKLRRRLLTHRNKIKRTESGHYVTPWGIFRSVGFKYRHVAAEQLLYREWRTFKMICVLHNIEACREAGRIDYSAAGQPKLGYVPRFSPPRGGQTWTAA